MSNLPLNISLLEKEINYTFTEKQNIITALTHSSYSNEHKNELTACECNERLEFLGDSVLSLVVSEYLFDKFANKPEGVLTKIRSSVVCTRSLSALANKIGLGNYILLGKGEEEAGRTNVKILENAFEALLAAIFVDSKHNISVVKSFLLPLIESEIEIAANDTNGGDYKTALQQFVQAIGNDKITYVCIGSSGPDHAKIFDVEARLNSNVVGKGAGKTKREAEQNAAKEALDLFGVR